jgi:hypothetical protein
MSIDKALYPAPTGMDQGVSIEIEDPESVTINTGDVEITLEPENDYGGDFDSNLAEILDEGELATISSDLMELVDADISSRKDWAETFVKGLEVLGMNYEERTQPWNGACGVFNHPDGSGHQVSG